MIVVASANGMIGMDAAWDVVAGGGSAVDAVEAGTRLVEANPDDHTVGYGGYPNVAGDVELDASIMEGTTRRAGAVGALRGFRHAITVARAVMDRLPHALIAGDGAARLARELGMEEENLLTEAAEKVWRDGLAGALPEASMGARMLSQLAALATDPEDAAGTVNFIAVDARGRMACAVSTSGWAFKYPGRLGDSPVIGAGNYCDDRFGAAACTGFGELAIRGATAHTVVSALATGAPVERACERAVRDLALLGVPADQVIMSVVAVNTEGDHCGVTTRAQGSDYAVRTASMPAAELRPRAVIALEE